MAESSWIMGKEPLKEEAVPRVPRREVDPNEAGCSYQVSGKREEKSMMALSKRRKREEPLKPPPGFHFKPTDSELAFNYLLKKQRGEPIPYDCIREVDVYEFHPQQIFVLSPPAVTATSFRLHIATPTFSSSVAV